MYWTQLFNLHCGVSFIGEYSSDLRVAIDGTYRCGTRPKYADGPDGHYKEEFTAALAFAAQYAGYHASGAVSPGAWIAFRENHTVLAENGIPEARRKLKRFTGDYTFLMKRLPGDSSSGDGMTTVGPDRQRYGAWARKLPAHSAIKLQMDLAFAQSLKGNAHKVRVVYLGDGVDFSVRHQNKAYRVKAQNNAIWNEAVLPVAAADSPGREAISIRAGSGALTIHMLEVRR